VREFLNFKINYLQITDNQIFRHIKKMKINIDKLMLKNIILRNCPLKEEYGLIILKIQNL
jgi:hypothetical protein